MEICCKRKEYFGEEGRGDLLIYSEELVFATLARHK
jgi:hypothetical protein